MSRCPTSSSVHEASHTRLMPRTTIPEVLLTFCRTQAARSAFDQWLATRGDVATVMLGHVTSRVYDVTSSDVEHIARTTEHALGSVRREQAAAVPAMRDWSSPFAMTHALHACIEQIGLPTFGAFRDWCANTDTGRYMLWDDLLEIQNTLVSSGVQRESVMAASRWRIGNAYYSFMRELYVLSTLRECDLDVFTHPVADSLFRVDAWTSSTMLSIYIGNSTFRDGTRGRKVSPVVLNGGAMKHHEIRLETPRNFGRIHLPDHDAIATAAREMMDVPHRQESL